MSSDFEALEAWKMEDLTTAETTLQLRCLWESSLAACILELKAFPAEKLAETEGTCQAYSQAAQSNEPRVKSDFVARSSKEKVEYSDAYEVYDHRDCLDFHVAHVPFVVLSLACDDVHERRERR
jgi:hypothetical protein